jgi:hypothetical protein
MEALVRSVQELFSGQHRYVVPPYQRPYVWTEERQWEPLWEDIERITDSRLADEDERHFLGAVVIRREKTPVGGITEWSVIDGQQRLTTLQLLMSGLAAAAGDAGQAVERQRLEHLLRHPEHDAEGDERFKFWPTRANEDAFRDVLSMTDGTVAMVDDPNNTVHEAWTFFRRKCGAYAEAEGADPSEVSRRFSALRESVAGLLQIVTISLDKTDPAQVIFETLNARGTPLLAMELLKNALFDRAAGEGASIAEIDERYWQPQLGDASYWSVDQRLGRVVVPRSEAFLYHWLVMQTGRIVAADNLFDTFRRHILSGPLADDAPALIRQLNDHAGVLRTFDALPADDRAGRRLFAGLEVLDTTTMVPVALLLYTSGLAPERRARALSAIESYLVRRLLRGLSTKNYSQLAARLIAVARKAPATADEAIVHELLSSGADTFRWPTDEELATHLETQSLYGWLGQKRIAFVLGHLERAKRSVKSEDIALPSKLEVEHVMPQAWQSNWPLDDPDDVAAAQRRNAHVNLLGNLTLVTGPLNAAMSNGPWPVKREGLDEHSVLLLNRELVRLQQWGESEIAARGAALTEAITEIWPGPQHFMPAGWQAVEAESWAEDADMALEDVLAVYAAAGDHLRAMLDRLATEPGRRWAYGDLEQELGWPRGRIAGISGGYGQGMKKRFGGKRPWHIHLTRAGAWEMWMDAERAAAIQSVGIESSA